MTILKLYMHVSIVEEYCLFLKEGSEFMNNKGFTLVEIIAVIAIMSLIIVVAAPNIFKFGDNANSSALKTKLDNIETATI